MDTSPLGVLCARTMEQIEERFGEDCIVRSAAIVLDVDSPEASEVFVASTEDRSWTLVALLKEGVYAVEDIMEAARGED